MSLRAYGDQIQQYLQQAISRDASEQVVACLQHLAKLDIHGDQRKLILYCIEVDAAKTLQKIFPSLSKVFSEPSRLTEFLTLALKTAKPACVVALLEISRQVGVEAELRPRIQNFCKMALGQLPEKITVEQTKQVLSGLQTAGHFSAADLCQLYASLPLTQYPRFFEVYGHSLKDPECAAAFQEHLLSETANISLRQKLVESLRQKQQHFFFNALLALESYCVRCGLSLTTLLPEAAFHDFLEPVIGVLKATACTKYFYEYLRLFGTLPTLTATQLSRLIPKYAVTRSTNDLSVFFSTLQPLYTEPVLPKLLLATIHHVGQIKIPAYRDALRHLLDVSSTSNLASAELSLLRQRIVDTLLATQPEALIQECMYLRISVSSQDFLDRVGKSASRIKFEQLKVFSWMLFGDAQRVDSAAVLRARLATATPATLKAVPVIPYLETLGIPKESWKDYCVSPTVQQACKTGLPISKTQLDALLQLQETNCQLRKRYAL